ncbi:hypothetical protein LEP1GSC163_3463 [Leptospira santarosai str. CBC379]|uniref:Uncharacterized protein n=3 Tax=Leptospira santarosai TaxID=28183 RepID=M6JWK1_9LEPT|nr:hypothetical protein LEP1GSC163_3463 [Leptospira santarosai str. CBC379]EMN19867.1 hypothetical protein LEP1GSC063_2123 [Leptospira santarosai serovar Arenal str. MAVJ 401]
MLKSSRTSFYFLELRNLKVTDMTGTYEWNPMPHKIDVRCPQCLRNAIFEFAEIRRIEKKIDILYFKESDKFDYLQFVDSCGHKWHAAAYFIGLHGSNTAAISNLPVGYKPTDWEHSKYYVRLLDRYDHGSIVCSSCGYRSKHVLNWPDDAYYQIEIKNKKLWAFNFDSYAELIKYIESKDRNLNKYQWGFFLLHLPTEFLKSKVRSEVVKRLRKITNY